MARLPLVGFTHIHEQRLFLREIVLHHVKRVLGRLGGGGNLNE